MTTSFFAELTIAALLSIAAWQDLKTREVDVWLFVAMALPAAFLAWANWGNPFYYISLAAGILLALFMRALGTGYADSLALAAVSTAPPPLPFLPTAFVVVIASAVFLPATALWLYYKNRGRPCKMSLAERLTHICVSRAEYEEALARGTAFKYIVGEERDMERYKPPEPPREEWIKAKYGIPYLVYLAAGYWAYLLWNFVLLS